MKKYYQIKQGKISPTTKNLNQIQLIQLENTRHRKEIISEYDLPLDIFDWEDHPEISLRLEKVNHDKWGWTYIIFFSHLEKSASDVEILSSLLLIIAVGSLVGALWGINTPNLPHQDHPLGSWFVFALAIVSMMATAINLKYKDI